METPGNWRRCSSCKTPIGFEQAYWVCNVSTCNRKRTGFAFCSVSCWDAHLPVVRHRESWALERKAPSRQAWEREQAEERAAAARSSTPAPVPRSVPSREPRRIRVGDDPTPAPELPRDILVVSSKLKVYVRAASGMNTSDGVMGVLSDVLRTLCDQAIRRAREDGRKTVMERDFKGRS